MRFAVLLGMAALFTACTTKEAPPAADTAAATALPPGRSLASMAGIWDVNVYGETGDSVLTTYILNNTDTTAWLFAFPNGGPIPMRVTNRQADTLVMEAGPFDSNVRPGMKARTVTRAWLEGGKLIGTVHAKYETTGPDTARTFRIEGTRR